MNSNVGLNSSSLIKPDENADLSGSFKCDLREYEESELLKEEDLFLTNIEENNLLPTDSKSLFCFSFCFWYWL